jgi:hypothetical protein
MRGYARRVGRRAARWAARKLLLLLLPWLAYAALFLLALVVMAVLVAMAPQTALHGTEPDPRDAAALAYYQKLASTEWDGRPSWNAADCWLVPGEPSESQPWYPRKGVENFHELRDRYGQDRKLILPWSTIHSVCLYWAFVKGEPEVPDRVKDAAAEALHPWFYYKESKVTVCTKDGCESYPVWLLVEASTINGHFIYSYEWVTRSLGQGATITEEVLRPGYPKQIAPDPYARLKRYLEELYEVHEPERLDEARIWIAETSTAFRERKEWLEWLWGAFGGAAWASSAAVPPDLMPIFREAEGRFGIPWWFLAAVAWKESGFQPDAWNEGRGGASCYGLMQVSEQNWNAYAPLLGFDPVRDRTDPRAQVMVGAFMLKSLLPPDVNWEDESWKERTLDALAFYGGFRTGGVVGEAAKERCRAEYAGPIWEMAEQLSAGKAVWPVPGYHRITCPFGKVDAEHPDGHKGIDIAAPQGAVVVAVTGGIAYAGYDERSGNFVVVKDAAHEYTYCHLSQVLVVSGQTVRPGDAVGLVGSTGRSTGPHLHFEVQRLDGGGWLDPLLFVAPE